MADVEGGFLICFSAFHLEDIRDVAAMKDMLSSWANQTIPAALLMHGSAAPDIKPVADRELEKLGHLERLFVEVEEGRASQFQHYRSCCMRMIECFGLEEACKFWVVFSDADDIWSPRRLERYYDVLMCFDQPFDAIR
ncbi:hypothetical protein DFJ74DRAFT_765907 [Hyaloraphidium curvatum]|nr:hypothetical protein DFJ74DRAFT_765907 [Hyaloraphidium curvatum]